MAIRSTTMQRIKDYCWRYASMFLRWIIQPSVLVTEAKQRRRLRLLSIFLLIIAIWTIIGMLAMMSSGNRLWSIMAVTGTALIILYGLSRTRYYHVATVLAVIVPAVPSFSEIFLGNGDYNVTSSIMWLALPLLVSGVLLSLRYTIIVAISYNIAIAFFIPLAGLPPYSLMPTLPFISVMSIIVIAIAAVRQQDQSEIERQLTERMGAEEALREREKRFSDIAENALEWIWEVDTKGKYTYSSPVVEQILGYKPEEILGKYFYDSFHPEDKEEMKKAALEAFAQKQPFHEFINRNVRKNGEIVILSTSGVPVIDEAGKLLGYRGVDTDITERKRGEEALRESEEKHRKLVEQSRDSISFVDPKGNIQFANEASVQLTGYPLDEGIGMNLRHMIPLRYWPKSLKKLREAMKGEPVPYFETAIKRKDGTVVLIEAGGQAIWSEGKIAGVQIIARDITERKRAEEALRESEVKFSTAFSSSPDVISIVNLENHRFIEVNDSFTRYTGYTREEVIGHTADEVHIWAEAEERDKIRSMQKEKGSVSNEEIHTLTKSGDIRVGLYSAETINIGGEMCSITVIADITERKRAEEALADEATRRRILIEQSRDGIVILEQEGGVYEANQQFADMLGYSIEEANRLSVLDWEYQFPSEQVLEMIRTVDEAGDHFETRHRRKDGSTYDVEISTNAAWFAGQKLIFCVCRDITERKRAEEAIRESEEKFSKAFLASPDSIAIVRMKDSKIIEVNDSFIRLNGYNREEIIGHTASELNIWADTKERDRILKIMEEQSRVRNEEFHYRKKSGEIGIGLFSAELINIGGEPHSIALTADITERKRAEEKLRESEEFSSSLMRSSAVPIQVVNSDTSIMYVNPAFEELTGFTSAEAIGKKAPLPWWIKDKSSGDINELKRDIRTGIRGLEKLFQKKNGERFWVEVTSVPVERDGKFQYSLENWLDITERKRAEEALRESEEKFSKAFRLSPDMVTINTLGNDGIFIDVSDSFIRTTGYSREEVIGRSSIELGIWASKEDNDRMLQILTKHGRVRNEEYTMRIKSGEMRVWLFSVEPIKIGGEKCVICVNTDITERKRAEEALRESEEKFSKAFRSSPDAIAITTVKDGKFIEVNDSYTRITGYTREEVIGRSSSEFGAWAKKEERNRVIHMLKEQGRVSNEEVHLYAKSGKIMICLFSAELINISGEQCMISLATDITRRKQAEGELKKALTNLELSSAQLTATNKELEAFSYSVSHDLRSPLRSIDGFSQALLEDYMDRLDEDGRDYLSRLRGASQKMGELIDGLLKLSRLTRSEMHREKVDLSALAKEITARLKETRPERRVDFVIGRGLTVSGDRQLLRVLMENLLGNAWKFTSKREQAKIEFGAADNGDKKAYFIKDNGAGFDMTYANRLFSAFQRLHETTEFPGTGIGLATVQRIINRHGGSVWAEGAAEKGATFYFTLN